MPPSTTPPVRPPPPRSDASAGGTAAGTAPETDDPDWTVLKAPDGGVGLAFQTEEDYVRLVWPASPGDQQMMMHLEIRADDLDSALEHALAAGATLADHQPQDDVRVCLDPAGHPFCLYLPEQPARRAPHHGADRGQLSGHGARGRRASSTRNRWSNDSAMSPTCPSPERGEERDNRVFGVGPLLGVVTGVVTGVGTGTLYGADGAARAPGRRPGMSLGAAATCAAVVAGSNLPMAALGLSAPRPWRPSDCLSDLLPHPAYGAETAAVRPRAEPRRRRPAAAPGRGVSRPGRP